MTIFYPSTDRYEMLVCAHMPYFRRPGHIFTYSTQLIIKHGALQLYIYCKLTATSGEVPVHWQTLCSVFVSTSRLRLLSVTLFRAGAYNF